MLNQNQKNKRVLQTIVEPREMNHALGQSMLGVGKLSRGWSGEPGMQVLD